MTSEPRVIIDKLDVDNYPYWKRKMKFQLISKKLWTAVEPVAETTEKPGTRSVSEASATEEEAVPVYGAMLNKKKCHYCGKVGHLQANCRVKIADKRKQPRMSVAF